MRTLINGFDVGAEARSKLQNTWQACDVDEEYIPSKFVRERAIKIECAQTSIHLLTVDAPRIYIPREA